MSFGILLKKNNYDYLKRYLKYPFFFQLHIYWKLDFLYILQPNQCITTF